jgi:hypothetical protein
MKDICRLIWWAVGGLVRSRAALEAENLVPRQQINVLRRTAPRRHSFNCLDRAYWRWKSRSRGGRPLVAPEVRRLIHEMSVANPLWGAPRIHGELRKLGIDIGQTSVAKYMARRRRPSSQGWKTLLRNHAEYSTSIASWMTRARSPWVSFDRD